MPPVYVLTISDKPVRMFRSEQGAICAQELIIRLLPDVGPMKIHRMQVQNGKSRISQATGKMSEPNP
jgi:hypothetical protein